MVESLSHLWKSWGWLWSYRLQKACFPGGLVVKTLHCQWRGRGFDPWLGNWDPTCCIVWPKDFFKKLACIRGTFFSSVWKHLGWKDETGSVAVESSVSLAPSSSVMSLKSTIRNQVIPLTLPGFMSWVIAYWVNFWVFFIWPDLIFFKKRLMRVKFYAKHTEKQIANNPSMKLL